MAVQVDIGYNRDINHPCKYIEYIFITAKDGHYKYGKGENQNKPYSAGGIKMDSWFFNRQVVDKWKNDQIINKLIYM